MILALTAQEFAYAAEQTEEMSPGLSIVFVGMSIFILFAGIASGSTGLAFFGFVMIFVNGILGILNLQQVQETSVDGRTNVVAIEEDYGVEVLTISEPEKSNNLETQKASLDVRIGADTLSCTQYVDTAKNVYSIYCGEGLTQSPLETLTK